MSPSLLNVVTAISNPVRYKSRYRLHDEFAKRMLDAGVRLITVEVQQGERPFAVTRDDNPHHLQLRTRSELWHKENALNLGVAHLTRLHPDWKYVGTFDADIAFANPDWASEAVHALQHHPVIQPWSHSVDLLPDHTPLRSFYTGPDGETLRPASWGYCHVNGVQQNNVDLRKSLEQNGKMDVAVSPQGDYGSSGGGYYFHPGYSWCFRREAWDQLGGLIDFSILGAADYLMAVAMTNEGGVPLPDWIRPSYKRQVDEWARRARQFVQGDVGYVPGLLTHYWHGKKSLRGYKDRWRIFFEHGFDPDLDLKRDAQGLYQLTDRSPGLRDDLRRYLRSRNEDGIDA